MTETNISVDQGLMRELLSGDGGMVAKLMESLLNQVMSAQADEAAGAGRYEPAPKVWTPKKLEPAPKVWTPKKLGIGLLSQHARS